MGTNLHMLNLIDYEKAFGRVQHGKIKSELKEALGKVVLSSTVFNIYTKIFFKSADNIKYIRYADDTEIMAKNHKKLPYMLKNA